MRLGTLKENADAQVPDVPCWGALSPERAGRWAFEATARRELCLKNRRKKMPHGPMNSVVDGKLPEWPGTKGADQWHHAWLEARNQW